MRKRNKSGNNSSPNSYQSVSELIRAYHYLGDREFFGKVNKNDGALLADLKRDIRRWCEPDIIETSLQITIMQFLFKSQVFSSVNA